MNKKGFTLIELLVVIAIIGILTGIVLASLGTARTRARDARIRADLDQIRSIAELINDRDAAYNNLCAAGNVLNSGDTNYGTQLGALTSDIDTQNGAGAAPVCYASGDQYCVSAVLASGGNTCIGHQGIVTSTACTAADSCH